MSGQIWNDSLKRVLCNNLRSVREKSNLSQKHAAFVLGITQSEYQRYECGKVKPSLTFLLSFALLFEVSLDDLFGLRILAKEKNNDGNLPF